MDLGDIYMNINNQGYVNLNVGDVKGLNMFRNFQAINSYINDKISLPDFKYEIIDIEGKDVISIIPDKYNSAAATLTAKSEGTAIVLVTYDAMYSDSTVKNSNGDAGDGNRYTAIWPDRTGVFVVSVGKDGTAVKSNMTCNGAVFDAEHSPQFYIGNEGASVSFIPDEGVTVTVNRSTVGKETLSFKEFTSEGVTVDSETGKVTVSGLKTGRHIIKLEKDGVASYQVVTAQQVTVDIVRSDGTELGLDSTIAPGTALADISEKGHDWGEPEYTWADDGSSCEAKRVCNRNRQHIENAKATEIKSEVAKPATCSAMGDTRYEAIFEENWAHDYKAITDIPVDEDAHEWGEWKVVKEATYSEEGLMARECKLCEDGYEEKVIPKILKPSAAEDPITIVLPGSKTEDESNPNTGAPIVCSFDLTAAGVVVLAATAAVLEIKRRK